ncbi:MAG: coproporphyrinogen oxidase [Deltaproteobacteria bacterium]|nr:coproporphyrinogen oxidase [Deltaproteobacteria bacterium]
MSCSIYIHIPFCSRKCSYCDFNSYDNPEISPLEYVDLLLGEISATAAGFALQPAATLYFGGGTPSLLPPAQIARLIAAVRQSCGLVDAAEVTLEANPGTITLESLQGYLAAGVNRLSIGVQSLDDAELRLLGRIHSADAARAAFALARTAGFRNIGIDLMHSLPGQSSAAWQTTLREAIAMRPEHISAYGLTAEEGTPFAAMVARGDMLLPEEDLAVAMFELTAELLQQAGYDHYEIANFALPGLRSRHNQVYWRREAYLGFGAGAHSFSRAAGYGVRWENPAKLAEYAAVIMAGRGIDKAAPISRREAMAEFFFLGLRLTAGVDPGRFSEEFGVAAEAAFPGVIERQIERGLMVLEGGMLRLTSHGLLLANRVMQEFV